MRTMAAVWLVALGACKLGASLDDARFRCSETSPCPPGRTCLDGYCELEVPADAKPPAPAVLGDVVMFTFDDGGLPLFRDRSGHRFDMSAGGARVETGVYGGAPSLEPSNFLSISDQPELFLGNQLTIEAWRERDAAGELDPIFGDLTIDPDEVAAEYSLEVTADDRLRFVTNDGCLTGPGRMVESGPDLPVPDQQWVHVAVAWDDAEARFYIGGEPAGAEPLDALPCELDRTFRVGRQHGNPDQTTMVGRIDELKVSSLAKSEADIRASMEYDSTELLGRCGDLLVEGEGCDGDSPCCDPAACAIAGDGEPCGDDTTSATCALGVCQVGASRPSEGLVALYELEEMGGTMIVDSSGVAPQVNLTIPDPGAVTWGPGYLEIDSNAIIQSSVGASKIHLQCSASGEVTVEAWVEPGLENQSGQIVAMGDGDDSEFGLGQYSMSWVGRVRSEGTSGRGTPHVPSAVGDVAGELTHLVLRRDAGGVRTLFVNGRERGHNVAPGDADSWGAHALALGDEMGGNDPWRGRIYRVAIYCRALSDLEVAGSYLAGSGPPAD